jgi:hypothetical protein
MRLPNPRVSLTWLPKNWRWADRLDRWRCERGILTGRWTQAEVDEINRRAHKEYLELRKHFD